VVEPAGAEVKVSSDALLSLRGVIKEYPGTVALKGMDLDIRRGEVHALLGPNGAGKSTVARLVGGAERVDKGSIFFEGEDVTNLPPRELSRLGIAVVHQGLNLFPPLTVAENLGLLVGFDGGDGFLSWRAQRRASQQILGVLDHQDIDVRMRVEDLRPAEAWLVTLSAALAGEPKLLILDESTAALSQSDAERLFGALRGQVKSGLAVIVVSHRMGDIRAIADVITVLREGAVVATVDSKTSTDELIALMFGSDGLASEREIASHRPVVSDAATVLSLQGVSTGKLRDVSFDLRAGEVLGVAGGLGSGRSELVRTVGGLSRVHSGEMTLNGRAYLPRSPRQAIDRGVAVVPENRDANGVLPGISVSGNATISSLGGIRRGKSPFVSSVKERRVMGGLVERFGIKGRPDDDILTLSGGNRQKVLLGRAALIEPSVLLMDDPTSGLDIASRVAMGRSIQEFAAEGGAVIVTSDEFDELLRVCGRLVVLREGALVEQLVVDERLTEQDIAGIAYADAVSKAGA
jgi:ABC-type sugar transport system ATPase subunit